MLLWLSPANGFSLLSQIHPAGIDGDLQFGYELDRRRTSLGDGETSKFERMNFTERLRLLQRWIIFDPRLVKLATGGTFGLFQEPFSSDGVDQENRGKLLGYELGASLLPVKPYRLDVFASRSLDTLTREFAGSSELLRESQGARLSLREVVPIASTLLVRRDRIAQDLRFASLFDRREEQRLTALYEGNWLGEVTDVNLGYEFDDVDDRAAGGLDFQTHQSHLSHAVHFGPYLEKSLGSRANLFERIGGTGSRSAQLAEDLRIDHTEKLFTNYRYNLSYFSIGDIQTTSHAGGLGAHQRVFESLTAGLDLQATTTSLEQGDTLGWGGIADLGYSKKIPLGGRFTAAGNTLYRIDDQDVPRGEFFIVGERHAFGATQEFFLQNPRVDLSSIVISDETGTMVFQEGFDYTLSEIGDRIQVRRIVGGRISEGQAVLVDYRFVTAPSLNFSTNAYGVNTSVAFNWISVYYRQQQSFQDLLSGGDSTFLDRVFDETTGVDLRWSGRWLHADARNEYRRYRSRRLAYVSPSFSQSLSLGPVSDFTVNLSVTETFLRLTKPERSTTSTNGRLGIIWGPFPWLFVDAAVNALELRDSVAPDERFVGGGVRARALYGRLSISPFFDYNRRLVASGRSTDLRTGVALTRTLF